jgi:hypothetical protein
MKSFKCGNCDGRGKLSHFSHVSEGVCFACKGSGRIAVSEKDWRSIKGMKAKSQALRDLLRAAAEAGDKEAFWAIVKTLTYSWEMAQAWMACKRLEDADAPPWVAKAAAWCARRQNELEDKGM